MRGLERNPSWRARKARAPRHPEAAKQQPQVHIQRGCDSRWGAIGRRAAVGPRRPHGPWRRAIGWRATHAMRGHAHGGSAGLGPPQGQAHLRRHGVPRLGWGVHALQHAIGDAGRAENLPAPRTGTGKAGRQAGRQIAVESVSGARARRAWPHPGAHARTRQQCWHDTRSASTGPRERRPDWEQGGAHMEGRQTQIVLTRPGCPCPPWRPAPRSAAPCALGCSARPAPWPSSACGGSHRTAGRKVQELPQISYALWHCLPQTFCTSGERLWVLHQPSLTLKCLFFWCTISVCSSCTSQVENPSEPGPATCHAAGPRSHSPRQARACPPPALVRQTPAHLELPVAVEAPGLHLLLLLLLALAHHPAGVTCSTCVGRQVCPQKQESTSTPSLG